MKKTILGIAGLFLLSTAQAQDAPPLLQKGAELTLNTPSGLHYQHIDFPRKNVIIKRGAIANFKSLLGEKLVVVESNLVDGHTEAILKRKNGHAFFRFYPTVSANLDMALAKGELKLAKSIREDSIVEP